MSVLRVEGDQTVAAVERLLGQINTSNCCDILLPRTVRGTEFAGLSLLMQFLITWSRKCQRGKLITHVQRASDVPVQMENLAATEHGMIALLIAPIVTMLNGTPVTLADKYASDALKRDNARIRELFERILANESILSPRSDLFFCCADDPGLYPPYLYHTPQGQKPSLVDEVDFGSFAARCFRGLTRVQIKPETKAGLGLILYELFRNTDDWARTTWDEVSVHPSIRGLRFAFHVHNTSDAFFDYAKGTPPLEHFFHNHPYISSLPAVVEISIFDSGSGLAQRWKRKPLSAMPLEAEFQAVMDCLRPHGTSSSESHRGIGLHDVMLELSTVKGFLWLRTGRLSLYRDFANSPYKVTKSGPTVILAPNEPYLVDWQSRTSVLTALAPVEGTCYTMLIPTPRN